MKEIIGFHGTKNICAGSIVSDNFKVATKRKNDNHWLGHGIYFYADYELAEWWANTKVKVHNEKYNQNDKASVIKAKISAQNILDLDNPFMLNKFECYCEELEREIVEQGIVLNFAIGDNVKDCKNIVQQRERCFWMDCVKENKNIDVIIYTFSKRDPAYAASKYHISKLGRLGLFYNEKQICVTDCNSIKERTIVVNDLSLDEVIV